MLINGPTLGVNSIGAPEMRQKLLYTRMQYTVISHHFDYKITYIQKLIKKSKRFCAIILDFSLLLLVKLLFTVLLLV